eukprot:CAMPEP_0194376824 /NCGR_PEP_ID=MMETSP0174-20130528/27649_1 /TAXON_ID=216777 /ORGANISM="Proboscia alata, Strain PI-D3" /LENGTH=213 /DNA_ID=CAMNT_0039157739 /DNA_START=12 /DNA_END=653 /DNA_ORIENTATION=+
MNNTSPVTPQDEQDSSEENSINSKEPSTKIVAAEDPLLTPNNRDLLDEIDCFPNNFYQAQTVTLKDPSVLIPKTRNPYNATFGNLSSLNRASLKPPSLCLQPLCRSYNAQTTWWGNLNTGIQSPSPAITAAAFTHAAATSPATATFAARSSTAAAAARSTTAAAAGSPATTAARFTAAAAAASTTPRASSECSTEPTPQITSQDLTDYVSINY